MGLEITSSLWKHLRNRPINAKRLTRNKSRSSLRSISQQRHELSLPKDLYRNCKRRLIVLQMNLIKLSVNFPVSNWSGILASYSYYLSYFHMVAELLLSCIIHSKDFCHLEI